MHYLFFFIDKLFFLSKNDKDGSETKKTPPVLKTEAAGACKGKGFSGEIWHEDLFRQDLQLSNEERAVAAVAESVVAVGHADVVCP